VASLTAWGHAQTASEGTSGEYTIRFRQSDGRDSRHAVEVDGLSEADLASLSAARWGQREWNTLLAVYVAGQGGEGEHRPAMLGSYGVDGNTLRFTPRFALEAGVRYRAVFHPARLPRAAEREAARRAVVAEFALPVAPAGPGTVVERVYPSADRLPENQLKFYIHFSGPMSGGEAYRHIHLLNASGQADDAAFLELGEELWDPTGTRFTLFIDPGRIKRGLKPREDLGPVLEGGNSYTLRVGREWPDASGNPLERPYEKKFQVGPPDDEPLDVTLWKLAPPGAGTRKPLVVRFPEPLDHAMLGRVLVVADSAGERVAGDVAVEANETRWRFTPESPWRPGAYRLVVDTALEDLAGNSIGRPFEVDVFRNVERRVKAETVSIPFEVRAGE
jgi:hypothetical protein